MTIPPGTPVTLILAGKRQEYAVKGSLVTMDGEVVVLRDVQLDTGWHIQDLGACHGVFPWGAILGLFARSAHVKAPE